MSHNHTKKTLEYCNSVRYRYVPVQETVTNELGTYVTYGISVRTVEEEIAFVSDVSTDRDELQAFAERCTQQQLDPLHLPDVIEDFLATGAIVS